MHRLLLRCLLCYLELYRKLCCMLLLCCLLLRWFLLRCLLLRCLLLRCLLLCCLLPRRLVLRQPLQWCRSQQQLP